MKSTDFQRGADSNKQSEIVDIDSLVDEELSRNSESVDNRDGNTNEPPAGLTVLTPNGPGTPG